MLIFMIKSKLVVLIILWNVSMNAHIILTRRFEQTNNVKVNDQVITLSLVLYIAVCSLNFHYSVYLLIDSM